MSKTSKFYNSIINRRIREFLNTDILSAKEFANKLNVSYETIRQWKNGYARPDIDKIDEISKILNCSIEYLIKENPEVINMNFKDGYTIGFIDGKNSILKDLDNFIIKRKV